MQPINAIALFRLSVLGPLASRERLEHGELTQIIRDLAKNRYDIPDSKRVFVSEKTIEHWYRLWKQDGINALAPKTRLDRGKSKLSQAVQDAIIECKTDNPKRSLDTIIMILEDSGLVARDELKRSSVHRLLQQRNLSRPTQSAPATERRSYNALSAGDLWCGDVMHGPKYLIDGVSRKVYLVSLMDDASRLLPHSAFCLGETALDIEGVLKQAVLKRGLPVKLVVDNGAAYRAHSLQGICARLSIRLIYCRPYDPESKGKIERFHRTFRQQFLTEMDPQSIKSLADLNTLLWAWIDQNYHQSVHKGLKGLTPLQRYQQDLSHIQPLGAYANRIDDLFYHRESRRVRKDGTISYGSNFYEVPSELVGKTVQLVFDPHTLTPLAVESDEGETLGAVTPQDLQANNQRKRQRPQSSSEEPPAAPQKSANVLVTALQKQTTKLALPGNSKNKGS
jgi:putative transposase